MKWIVSALLVLATATAWAQQPQRFTLTANTQCASVSAQNNSTVGIIVSGTWSGTLTPNLRIAGVAGAPTASTTVTPSNSTTSQGTITGNGGFKSSVGGFTQFNLCFTSFSSGSAIIDLLPTTALNAGLLGGGSPAGAVTGTGLTSGNVISGAGGSAIQDSTIPAAQVVTANSPGVGLCHFAGSTQACTSSTVVNADIAASTIDLTTKVTGVLPAANGGKIQVTTANQGYFWGTCQNAMAGLGSTAITALVSGSGNQVRAWQCVLPYSVTINKVSIEVQVNSAAQTCNVGIYSADRATKLVDSGTFDMSSGAGAAGTTRTNTLGAPVTVSGPIWVGFSCSDTTAAIGAAGGTLGANVGAVFANIAGGPIMGSAANATSAGVMPASLGTITQATTISTSPLMRFEP